MNENTKLPAGNFSAWLRHTREAQLKPMDVDVACGACTACCTSSYFVDIRADERETLARIHKELLFPAPGLPKGHKILGFDEKGHCPMLIDNRCSIYEVRPHTCRTYDCRLFAAVEMDAGDEDKILINQQAKRWAFTYPSLRDFAEQKAVKEAITFLRDKATLFPDNVQSSNPTHLALTAIKVYHVFFTSAHSDEHRVAEIVSELETFKKNAGR